MPTARTSKELVLAGAALLCVVVGTRLLTDEEPPPASWSYVAAALGCLHAAALGAVTVVAGRRATAAAWAPALLWPLAGPAPAAAGLAVLVGTLVVASRLPVRGRAVAAVLGVGALGVLVGAASATPPAAAPQARAALRPADVKPERGDADARDGGRADGDKDGNRRAGDDRDGREGDTETRDDGATRAAGAGTAIRAYYRALDARRFDDAWRTLSPGVQASFGGLAAWRAGFATTRSSRPEALQVAAAGDRATVRHVLTATDATACGSGVRRFALTWTLERGPGGAWLATAASGRLLSGGLPACP